MSYRLPWATGIISLVAMLSVGTASLATSVGAAPAQSAAQRHVTRAKNARSTATSCRRNKASGTIIYADVQFPDNLSPDQTNLAVTQETLDSMFDAPVIINDKGRLQADMLIKVPTVGNGLIRNGGREYIFNLKHGMRWSNGQAITSADLKFGLAIDKDVVSGPVCATSCGVVAHVSTPNKYTAIYSLKHTDAAFLVDGHYGEIWPTVWPGAWSRGDVHAAAVKLYSDSAFNFEGPGFPTSGPYQVASFMPYNRIILHPMKYYNILSCGASVKNLIFSFYSDTEAMLAAAASRTADVTQDYTLANARELLSHKRSFKTEIVPAFTIEHLEFNHDPKYNGHTNPLASTDVRLALALAVDKQRVLQTALNAPASTVKKTVAYSILVNTPTFKQPFVDKTVNGQWDPIIHKYIPSGSKQAITDAKKLLNRGGYAKGFTVDFQTTTHPASRRDEQSAICQNFQRINVNCTQLQTPSNTLFGNWNENGTLDHGRFQIALFGFVGGPDPDALRSDIACAFIDRHQTVHATVNANYSATCDHSIDRAFQAGNATLNGKARAHYYSIIQRRMDQEANWMLLYYRPNISTVDSKVLNFKGNPTQTGAEWNTWQWKAR